MICLCCDALTKRVSPDEAMVNGIVLALQQDSKGIASQLCEMHSAMVYHVHSCTKTNVPLERIRR